MQLDWRKFKDVWDSKVVYNLRMKRKLLSWSYAGLLKPVLFKFDPEEVHDAFTGVGAWLGSYDWTRKLTKFMFDYRNPRLEQEVRGIHFRNPVGLSAGFDYQGKMSGIMPAVGFGFESMGTVTKSYYEGNAKPRLGRLPRSKSLLVNKGFKSGGIEAVLNENVRFVDENFNLGISIGATNSAKTSTPKTQIEDILLSLDYLVSHELYEKFAYVEINISCPNVKGAGSLGSVKYLDPLLEGVRERVGNKPVWVKFPIEIDWSEAAKLIEVMINRGVHSVVIGNLLKKRDPVKFDADELARFAGKKGNFSGKPTWELSNALIEKTFNHYGSEISIVGVGGIFSAVDAYHKLKLGASLVELITGMVYRGPQLIGEINAGLMKLMDRDGFENIGQVVGSGV